MSFIPDPAQLPTALEILLAGIPKTREKVAKVGDGPRLSHAMAMRIGRNAHGDPTFVAETPVFHLGWQDRGHCFGGSTFIDVHRYEIKVRFSKRDAERADAIERGEGTGILKQDWMLVAKLPYSLGRVAWVKLKPSYRGRKDDRDDPPETARGCSETLWDWLDERSYDYWETRSYLKTAAFRTFDPAPLVVESLRNPTDECTGVALGICTDPNAVLERIKASTEYRRLLDDAKAAKRQGSWTRSNAQGKGPKTFPLNDPTLLDHAEEILDLSLRQAMSGPHNAPPNSLALLGKPVMLKARWIFDEHIKRLNDRVSSARSRENIDALSPQAGAIQSQLQSQLQSPDQAADQRDIGEIAGRFLEATLDHLHAQDEDLQAAQEQAIIDLFSRVDRLALSPEMRLGLTGDLASALIDLDRTLSERIGQAGSLVAQAGG